MLALERRNLILEKLQDEKRVVVSELSQIYGVSEETIRRDLEKLEQDGFATKSYGGAVLNENVGIDMPLNIRSKKNVAEKQKMAEIAATLVHDGDHIMLDASSTALFIAKALKNKQHLTVITNSIEIMLELSDQPGWRIISTGGNLKEGYLALLGTQAENTIHAYYADKAFVSCKALDFKRGIMESKEGFAYIKTAILESSGKTTLVLDSSKFDATAFAKAADLKDVERVVTDKKPSGRWLAKFEELGIECLYP